MLGVMYYASSFADDPLTLTLTLLGIIALVGSAVAVGRSALFKAQLETLRDNNTDLTNRVEILEHEKDILKHDNELLARDLKEEKTRREAIERIVTAQEELRELKTIMQNTNAGVNAIMSKVGL